MVKSIARKRKRQFYGNKFTSTSKKNSISAVPKCTASCSKLGKETFSTAEEMPGPVFGNRIVDLELIVEAFAQLCCPKCFPEKVELFEDPRYGLCSHFTLKCKCCDWSMPNRERKLVLFSAGVANGTKCSTKYAGLSNNVLYKIKPVYLELCDKQILSKCLHGCTQNANECFNGIVWQKAPKEVFVSLKTIKFGSYDAFIHFNEGLNGCLKVFNKMNIKNPGVFTLRGYKHLDKCRIRESIHNADPKTKKNRKILRALKKEKISVLEVKDGKNYKSGAF
ncbi:uncharacterized protein TNCV_43421 [Trichonephila clavipes]|nr:uncharacterized protein TNCV_43421 [Trichonephila clavipes]